MLLGAVHGRVGVPEEGLRVLAVGRVEADPHAGRDFGVAPGEVERGGQHVEDLLGEADDVLDAVHLRKDHGELVPAEARHRVAGPRRGPQAHGDQLEQPVPLLVPQGVVDRLETVEVEEQQSENLTVALGPRHRLVQAVQEQTAVREAGQRVVVGEVVHRLLHPLALDGIADRACQEFAALASLDQVVLGAALHRLHGQSLVLVAAQHHDRDRRRRVLDRVDRLQAVGVGEPQIEQDGIEAVLPEAAHRLAEPRDVGDFERGGPRLLQELAHHPGVTWIVFDEEEADHSRARCENLSGVMSGPRSPGRPAVGSARAGPVSAKRIRLSLVRAACPRSDSMR